MHIKLNSFWDPNGSSSGCSYEPHEFCKLCVPSLFTNQRALTSKKSRVVRPLLVGTRCIHNKSQGRGQELTIRASNIQTLNAHAGGIWGSYFVGLVWKGLHRTTFPEAATTYPISLWNHPKTISWPSLSNRLLLFILWLKVERYNPFSNPDRLYNIGFTPAPSPLVARP